MSIEAETYPLGDDPVSSVLKWMLLAVAIICFALFFWATALTYDRAPPQPDRFAAADGATLDTPELLPCRMSSLSDGPSSMPFTSTG